MWVFARKKMFFKGVATPGLNKVGRIMIKAQQVILGIRLCLNGVTEVESSLRMLERLPVSFVRFAREAGCRPSACAPWCIVPTPAAPG